MTNRHSTGRSGWAVPQNKENALAGAILAGGKNVRMGGQNKCFFRVNGIPLIKRTIDLFAEIFEEIILITDSPGSFKEFSPGIIMESDILRGVGPLGGIHAGLNRTTKEAVFFVACDMPFLKSELIREEIKYFKKLDCEALVPRIGKLIEPLHAVYKKSLKDSIRSLIKSKQEYSIRSLFRSINIKYLELENKKQNREIFINLNTPKDFKDAFANRSATLRASTTCKQSPEVSFRPGFPGRE